MPSFAHLPLKPSHAHRPLWVCPYKPDAAEREEKANRPIFVTHASKKAEKERARRERWIESAVVMEFYQYARANPHLVQVGEGGPFVSAVTARGGARRQLRRQGAVVSIP